MYAFFLGPIKHNLINRFSEETFSKTTNGIFGICFIQNFNDVFALKYSEKAHNLSMTFMSEWTYMLQYPRAKNISNNCCTLEKQYPFSKKKIKNNSVFLHRRFLVNFTRLTSHFFQKGI